MDLLLILNLIIALGIFNVWIIRFNQKTEFRGGTANSLKEEFLAYGLPLWFMYIIGFIKISLSTLLIIGIWVPKFNLYSALAMTILMIGAIIMHLKIQDPIKKSVPACCVLILLIGVILNSI